MDEFSYVDIFATKGIEYLLVIVFLVVFILFARALFTDRGKTGSKKSTQPGRHS